MDEFVLMISRLKSLRKLIPQKTLLCLWLFSFGHGLAAESDPINPFSKDYISLEYVKNYPTSKGQEQFSPFRKTLFLGYQHFLNQQWNVGITLGFKSFSKSALEGELALLSFSNHSYYVIRIHHPTYLMLGTKLIYMTPNEQSNLPLSKDADFETEVGIGISAQLTQVIGSYLLTLRADRWRGTKTNKLHGFELALGLSLHFN